MPLSGGGAGPHPTQCDLGRDTSVPIGILINPAVWPNRRGPKIGGCAPSFWGGGAGSLSNTMWPEPRPTAMPSFILVHPTVWPQYSNVTDRQDRQTERQRSDSIGRTVLQTVAQKWLTIATRDSIAAVALHSRHMQFLHVLDRRYPLALRSCGVLQHITTYCGLNDAPCRTSLHNTRRGANATLVSRIIKTEKLTNTNLRRRADYFARPPLSPHHM